MPTRPPSRSLRPTASGGIESRLPVLLAARGIGWSELARRTLLPASTVARLRARDADPRLPIAQRVAAAVGATVEEIWRCTP